MKIKFFYVLTHPNVRSYFLPKDNNFIEISKIKNVAPLLIIDWVKLPLHGSLKLKLSVAEIFEMDRSENPKLKN